MATRTANARWEGDLKSGNGNMAFGSFDGPYTYASRFEEGEGTNPEELIAAAHAGCFSMALSGGLSKDGHVAESIETSANVHLEGGKITRIELVTRGRVPGMDQEAFEAAAQDAKQNCPVSKALAGVGEITVDATLEG